MIDNIYKKNKEYLLNRAVAQILPNKEDLEKLIKKKKLKLYLGIDPTGTRLHLGHSITLRKLQQFAILGHEAILLVGTGTVLAGDPSQREETRPKISFEEIEKNISSWKKQAGKILDFSKVKIKYNGEWLLKLGLKEIIEIASHLSAIKLFQREMFQKRMKKGDTVWLHEILYPMLQGYDSVVMNIDLEIGGTDQVFNMLIGRELQQKIKKREKFVLTCPMILGTDGKQMSKSSGNCIWLEDSPEEMFGKIMSIPDDLIISYFELLTDCPQKNIEELKNLLISEKLNPKLAKKLLASEIVKIYHSAEKAKKAEQEFEKIFKQKALPSIISEIKIKEKKLNILDLLFKTKLVSSKAEAKRLVLQKGVKINKKIEQNWQKEFEIKKGTVIQVGKRRFVKIK